MARPRPSHPRSRPTTTASFLTTALLSISLLVPPGIAAQSTGGMLFSYRPHPGQRASFDEGYRSHLEWHRNRGDSLSWYGWDVLAGPRSGEFVDGTFGISFEALDRRVDPAGDAAHAERSFADHATALVRWMVRARPELSTAMPLEEHTLPAPLVQVTTYTVPTGRQGRVEDALRRARQDAGALDLLPFTVYEAVVGVPDVQLMLLVWRNGLASFDDPGRDPVAAVREALSGEGATDVRAVSELWRLRQDLTLVPEQEEPTALPTAWRTVTPGGDTGCALGEPFEFWVREGRPTEWLLFLQGGGACWTYDTCHPGDHMEFDATISADDLRQRREGIFDRSNPDNPFREASVVFVPYCTGDFHLGARRVTYEPPRGSDLAPVTVDHAGYANVTAVLDYLEARPVVPDRITVVGASAGAVASPVVAARIAERFPVAVVRQVGDGAAGLRFAGGRQLLEHWGAEAALADDGFVVPGSGDAFTALYRMAAASRPQIVFSQIATDADARVAAGLRLVGEDPGSVARKIQQSYAELAAAGICFRGWVLPGTEHTIVWRPELFSAVVDGMPLVRRLRRDVLEATCPA